MLNSVDDDFDATVAWDDSAALVDAERGNDTMSQADRNGVSPEVDPMGAADINLSTSESESVGSLGESVPESDALSEEHLFESEADVVTSWDEQEIAESESEVESSDSEGRGDSDDVVEPAAEAAAELDEESEGSPQPVRRSRRNPVPKEVFTYNQLGGNPTRERIT